MSETFEPKIKQALVERLNAMLLHSIDITKPNLGDVKISNDEIDEFKDRIKAKQDVYFVANKSKAINSKREDMTNEMARTFSLFVDIILMQSALNQDIKLFDGFLKKNEIDFLSIPYDFGYIYLVDKTDQIDPVVVKLATNLFCKRIDTVDLPKIVSEIIG